MAPMAGEAPERVASVGSCFTEWCLAQGQSSQQMARVLDISVRTVESHRQPIKRKFNIDGQAELIRCAMQRDGR